MAFEKMEVEDYEKKRYRGLDQKLVHSQETRLVARLLEIAGKFPGEALDLPCGYGRFFPLLQKKGFTPLNCDISFHMVERANARSKPVESARSWGVVADAVSGLPFKEKSFRLVFSMRFFHHLHESSDRRRVLKEFQRITAGWLLISYYQTSPLHRLQRKFRSRVKKSQTGIKMISEEKFREEAENAGFQVETIESLFWGIHSQRIALLKKIKT